MLEIRRSALRCCEPRSVCREKTSGMTTGAQVRLTATPSRFPERTATLGLTDRALNRKSQRAMSRERRESHGYHHTCPDAIVNGTTEACDYREGAPGL